MTEYIRLYFDMGDLHELNNLASVGWKVVQIVEGSRRNYNDLLTQPYIAFMERSIDDPGISSST